MINYCFFGCQHNRGLVVLGFENVLGVAQQLHRLHEIYLLSAV